MKKLVLATAFAFALSACSNSTKVEEPLVTKQQIIGTWACIIKYDNLKVKTLDISEFRANGEIKNIGDVSYEVFAPIKFTYKTEDQGSWDLKGNQLVIDYDLSKRKVTKTTYQEFLQYLKQKKGKSAKTAKAIADYEQQIFDILSDTENSKITLEILKFGDSRMSIQQKIGKRVYFGGCITAEKAKEYLHTLKKDKK